ncbi:ABC transporter permease [Leifsonia sp. RAF41]|uniref:ABC transporter permease n=1 Tax=Leifsonia sp. RAF41 TaxID=3233056 RepID=UPI003F947CC4
MTALSATAGSIPARPERPVTPFASTRVFVGRSIRHSLRDVEALTMAVVLPVMLMLLFTFVFGGALDTGGGYVQYVVPGIILLCAGFGASSTAVDVARDMSDGIVDRFRTMPLRSRGVITGHVVASLFRNLLATGVVIGVALLVGFRPTANLLQWAGALGMVALFILAITWLYAGLGLAAKSPTAASSYGFALLFLPYLSSAFVPTDTMPTWLRWVADNQPITPIIETIRALLFGRDPGSDLWWALGWCGLIIGAAYVWAAWLFRRSAGRR